MRIPFIITSAFLLMSCKPPLAPLQYQQIIRISIHPLPRQQRSNHINTTISDKNDIDFIVQSLSNMKARGFDHSSPDFDLLFETSTSNTLKLRVSDLEVGPDAPASANNTHWFPSDKAAFRRFYDFLLQKTLTSK
jgi:hypothetical protein